MPTYASVYQHMSENFIRNSYVTLIRSSVTGPLDPVTDWGHFTSRVAQSQIWTIASAITVL